MTKAQAKTKDRGPELFEGAPEQTAPAADAKESKKRAAPATGTAMAKLEPPPMNLVSMIGHALANPAIDTVKLREIVDWYDKREADNAFARDFLAMAKELPEIKQDGTIDQGITRSGRQGVKSKYATYPNIHKATAKILHDHGFTLSNYNTMRGEQVLLVVRLEHYDHKFGSSYRESMMPIIRDDSGGKTSVQAFGSGEQYLLRRMVIKILNLRSSAPEDDDLDGHDPAKAAKAREKPQTITGPQAKALLQKIDECGVPSDLIQRKFAAFGITRIHDLPASAHDDFVKSCNNYKAEAERRAKG